MPTRLHHLRPDIEGMRAVAITAVVAYHAGVGVLDGGFVGVDLFFVLSGFLITGMLVRELERTGRVDLREFWARRIRRLLPAASVVLITVAGTAAFVTAPTMRGAVAAATVWSTLYGANWFFARDSLDYLAADDAPSPLLHFWSLGVEEQFYFVWPVGLVLLVAFIRARRLPIRPWLVITAIAVIASSLLASAVVTEVSQPLAFFGSPTRFWQLGVGALLAITAPWWGSRSAVTRSALAWGGLAGLTFSLLAMGDLVVAGWSYPGVIATLPTLAAAALVASGIADGGNGSGPARLLSLRPLQWLGARSYSWYLWHWPVLVFFAQWHGDYDALTGMLLGLAALALADLTHRFVENPIRFSTFLRPRAGLSLGMGAVLMMLSIGAAGALRLNDAEHLEARLTVDFRPLPSAAYDDISELYAGECQLTYGRVSQPECIFGDTAASRRIVLMGDSHATNIFAALDLAARDLGYALDARVKSRCTMASVLQWVEDYSEPFATCSTWREATLQDLQADPPAAVVLVTSANPPPTVYDERTRRPLDAAASLRAWSTGYRETLTRLAATGTRVIVVRDNPKVPANIPDCVAANMTDPAACDFERTMALPEPAADLSVATRVRGVEALDYTDAICNDDECFAVTNGILAWQKGSHYTETFSRSLAARITADLRRML